jgi:S1-C subfamily serine protease/HEAT repeat protein
VIVVSAAEGGAATAAAATSRAPAAASPHASPWIGEQPADAPTPGARSGGGALWVAVSVAGAATLACAVLATVLIMERSAEPRQAAAGNEPRITLEQQPADEQQVSGDELIQAVHDEIARRQAARQAAVAQQPEGRSASDGGEPAAAGEAPAMPAGSSPLAAPVGSTNGPPRYLWRKGDIYSYNFEVVTELGDEVRTTTGSTVLRASPWRDEPQPGSPQPGQTADPAGDAQDGPEGADWSGTAFVVHADGYLATCAHVVDGAQALTVHLNGGAYAATVVATDAASDVALVRINARGLNPLPLADANRVALGESVRVLGFPYSDVLGQSLKVSAGIVSGVVDGVAGRRFQVDAPLNHGNSGGPVLSDRGEVVGVASSGFRGAGVEGLGLAAPAEAVLALMAAQQLSRASGAADASLTGPALVARAARSVAYVEATGAKSPAAVVGPAIRFQASATTHVTAANGDVGGFGRPMGGMISPQFAAGTLWIDTYGEIRDVRSDMRQDDALEFVGLVLEPLDPAGRASWSEEETVDVSRASTQPRRPWDAIFPPAFPSGTWGAGSPYGPYGPRSPLGPQGPFGPRPPYGPFGQSADAGPLAPLTLHLERSYRIVARNPRDGTIVVEKMLHATTERAGADAEVTIDGSGQFTFDVRRGCLTALSFQQTVTAKVQNVSIDVPMHYTLTLATPEEYVRQELPRAIERARETFDEAAAQQSGGASSAEDKIDDLLASISRQARAGNRPYRELAALAKVPVVPSRRAKVIKALVALAADGQGSNASPALDALEKWGDASCVPALLALLKSGDRFAHDSVVTVLGAIGDERAARPLAELMAAEDFPYQYERALIALGPAAEAAVIPLLANPNKDVRRSACNVLEEVGSRASIEPLNALLDEQRGEFGLLTSAAQRALGEIRSREAGRRMRDELAELAGNDLRDGLPGEDGGGAASPLVRAIEALSARGAGENEIRTALEALADCLPPDEATRVRVARLVAAQLDRPSDFTTRRQAFAALGRWAGPELEPQLLAMLDAADPATRPGIYAALGRTKSAAVGGKLLEELAAHGDNGSWAPAIADALALTGAEVRGELLSRLASRDVAVRAMAARALAGVPGDNVDAALERQLADEAFTTIALEEAVKALARRRAAK